MEKDEQLCNYCQSNRSFDVDPLPIGNEPAEDRHLHFEGGRVHQRKKPISTSTHMKADSKIPTFPSHHRDPYSRGALTGSSSKSGTDGNRRTIWACPKAKHVVRLSRRIAPTNAAVLIQGETGTGKEVIARDIHRASGRKGSFIAVNCGAIPEALIASELFGYERGAFTGAHPQGHLGKFRAADKGTLFLDEIGEMPYPSQIALLRVLEDKRITPVGSHRTASVDVRIIAATNRNLIQDIRENRFRADLYYRLCEIDLRLPPLREREDLFVLTAHFLRQIALELDMDTFTLDDGVKTRMSAYDWPGNIRELKHTLRQAAYHAYFTRKSTTIRNQDIRFLTYRSERPPRQHTEEEILEQAILKTGGNLSQAAKSAGIGRTTLYRKLDHYPRLKKVRDSVKQKRAHSPHG